MLHCRMCLGFANFLVPPSPRARNIADYLKVVLVLHFGLAVCEIAAFRWFDGAFDILFALIGVLAIRNPEGYSLQQTMCYFLGAFSGFGHDDIDIDASRSPYRVHLFSASSPSLSLSFNPRLAL